MSDLIEERIKTWREQEPGEEDEGAIELLCDAEDELRTMREEVRRLRGFAERSGCKHPDRCGDYYVGLCDRCRTLYEHRVAVGELTGALATLQT